MSVTSRDRDEIDRRISQIDKELHSIQRIVARDGARLDLEWDALYRERAILKHRLKDI